MSMSLMTTVRRGPKPKSCWPLTGRWRMPLGDPWQYTTIDWWWGRGAGTLWRGLIQVVSLLDGKFKSLPVVAYIGSAYVFVTFDGGVTWSEQRKLVPSDGATDALYGQTVAVYGSVIAVGATRNTNVNGAFGGESAFATHCCAIITTLC